MSGGDHRKPCRHVLENLERRPVEIERERRVRAHVEGRHSDVRGRQARREGRSCLNAPVNVTPWKIGGRGGAGARELSGPSPIITAPMSARPRARSLPHCLDETHRAVPRAKRSGKQSDGVASGRAGSERNRAPYRAG